MSTCMLNVSGRHQSHSINCIGAVMILSSIKRDGIYPDIILVFGLDALMCF